MKYKIVPSIKAKGYPVNQEGYKQAHRGAQQYERERYGDRRFKALETIIKKKIPVGELAGSHTKKGEIIVSDKIPEKYHKQIVDHEVFEHRRMERTRLRKQRRTKKR